MRTAPWLLTALLLALPLRAEIAPDLADLTQQIERFPQSATGSESERLAKLFDLYWAASMRQAPDFASYVGYPSLEDRLPDLSPEASAHSRPKRWPKRCRANVERVSLRPGADSAAAPPKLPVDDWPHRIGQKSECPSPSRTRLCEFRTDLSSSGGSPAPEILAD
ncbi:MAG TPA: hypothetical protein VE078_19070 [Thermoanaerobaculia bacterium]|nr:hypothetical protein [Thermoanaerobaculia bacterium]